MRSKPLKVFEHSFLPIGEVFKKHHWEALDYYNRQHGGKYFTLTSNGIRFSKYVGVIQVNNLTIEILPKIGKTETEGHKAKWQKVLIDMLRECHWMHVNINEKAALRFKPNNILEAYFELFVFECEKIVREGLVKKYRPCIENSYSLKGKLLFVKQVQKNLIHKERFYIKHTLFDRENIYNRILLQALRIVPEVCQSPFLNDRVSNLMLEFPELENIKVTPQTFESLIYDRKTTRYKDAIEIAAMLLLNYRPDISHGRNHILAILFDMNDLWEEYITRQLKKNKPLGVNVRPQYRKSFWETGDTVKKIRPDIVIEKIEGNKTKSLILDTKWKLPNNNIPDDDDLKQMFVYNEYWSSKTSILFYPHATFLEQPKYISGSFVSRNHQCGIMKISVLDKENDKLDCRIGDRIYKFLESDKYWNYE